MNKKKKEKIIKQVKLNREAKRKIKTPEVISKTFLTHKKDIEEKQSNTIKEWEE